MAADTRSECEINRLAPVVVQRALGGALKSELQHLKAEAERREHSE